MNKPVLFFLCFVMTLLVFIVSVLLLRGSDDWLLGSMGKSKTLAGPKAHYLEVPNIVINLPGRSSRMCKAGFTLQVKDEKNVRLLSQDKYMGIVKDTIITNLSSIKQENLLTFNGKMRLKREIKKTINRSLNTHVVHNVYLRELLIQ